ncbi:hypothetical protein BCR33DRAFT_274140 [Rhizoclosmatium globosum]|uniref:Uncharacterized protein n=1 Tax=Rhizoclosmatium globosum TaxID=329046 RepID=A0A1Y2C8F8_9FUNG|nr:hypothetical protein BCR33DRAFT_274140 [Rhizoclosmatium globosum]|eukprot:ORY43187.1 hypothetical protein BCR33DRAFT_274140 [Rhizoclosmatium globosum]
MCFTRRQTISPVNPIPWFLSVNKKRKLFPGAQLASLSSLALPQKIHIPVPEY